MDKNTQTELEAAAFRDLISHLQLRTDVQNIDLMNLAGFCRNCLAKWYLKAAEDQGETLTYEQACEAIYGMPYVEWKSTHQTKASEEQLRVFEETRGMHSKISGHSG